MSIQTKARRWLVATITLAVVLAGCGSTDENVGDASAEPVESTDDTTADTVEPEDEDHDEEDGDDHDEDEDHDDEDDDDHDEDHGDEDHDDEDGDDHGDHDDESGGLGAHEHGSAELAVAWIDSDIVIDLISPVQNVFGFEYEPETDEDKSIAADRTAALTADGVVTINDAADCSLTGPAETEIEREASHSEISVSWSFSCNNPAEVANVDLSALFAEFPGFEDIDAEWVSSDDQSSAELSPAQPTLELES